MNLSFLKAEPRYDKQTFLRKAWISLAKEDVPLDVFNADFGEVVQEEYHLLCTGADYDLTWNAEIGNNRLETYLDVETYFEREPYTAYVKKYVAETKSYIQEPVTQYRDVQKQRQVKKERLVTDWHSGTGMHSGHAESRECVDNRCTFSERRYKNDVTYDDFSELSSDELEGAQDMIITGDMHTRADLLRIEHAEAQLASALPGDKHRALSYRFNSYVPTYAKLYRFPEYAASIVYGGQTYTKRAFPLGEMTMELAAIPNPISVEEVKKGIEKERVTEIEKERSHREKKAWGKALPIYLTGIGLLIASIVISILVHYLLPVVLVFGASVAAFIGTKLYTGMLLKKTNQDFDRWSKEVTDSYNEKIKNYNDEHLAEIFQALNRKLRALGFEPATEDEFYNS